MQIRRLALVKMVIVLLAASLFLTHVGRAQQAGSRAELINLQRKDKQARLWPEHTPGLINSINKFAERGLLEGAESGEGTNGWQLVLGGMRSGNGTTFGVGYRRIDLWGERIAFRGTARGTAKKAYMLDFGIEFPRLTTDRSDLRVYAKYENSPMMDYYGPGPDSAKSNRSSYRLEDAQVDIEGRYRLWGDFYGGATGGIYGTNTGRGKRSGVPSTDDKFDPEATPGLLQQTNFLRAGAFLQYDYRDNPGGPTFGGNYYARYTHYWDQQLGQAHVPPAQRRRRAVHPLLEQDQGDRAPSRGCVHLCRTRSDGAFLYGTDTWRQRVSARL